MEITDIASQAKAMIAEIETAIVGKQGTVEKAILSLLCNGHLLIEDIPGVGKTTLAKAIAKTIGGHFTRIQFTPDLLPSDVTGTSIFNQKTAEFQYREGPIFGNVVLVDEINRATPKTQSALLEAMEERQVTADGATRMLPHPFFVIATQNTIEMTGTYPLPEAQMDRFFGRVSLGYPSRDSETAILSQQQTHHPLERVREVCSPEKMVAMQQTIREIYVSDAVKEYVVDVVRATRDSAQLLMGASPRGSLYLMRAAQARAATEGHDHVRPDDVKYVAPMVLAHRVMARSELRARGVTTEEVIEKIMTTVNAPVPVG